MLFLAFLVGAIAGYLFPLLTFPVLGIVVFVKSKQGQLQQQLLPVWNRCQGFILKAPLSPSLTNANVELLIESPTEAV